jgi:hypothetical protein
VTTEAGHFIVRGSLPGFNIFLHVVTEATKGRLFRKSENDYEEEEQKEEKRTVEDLPFPFGKP